MEQYTQEWLTFHLLKLKSLFWCNSTDPEWDSLLENVRKIADAVTKITGLSREDTADLVANRLMVSEDERQAFFREYNIPSEFDNICLQMQTSA